MLLGLPYTYKQAFDGELVHVHACIPFLGLLC